MPNFRPIKRPRTLASISESIGVAVDVSRRLSADRVYRLHELADVIRRWDAGFDSVAIATATSIPEHEVCRIIAADRERRRELRVATTPGA